MTQARHISTIKTLLLVAGLALAGQAWAQVDVSQAWVRATVAQQKATGAFLQLRAKRDSRLVEAHSKAAGAVEVHEMVMDGSTMKMRAVPALELPAGQLVELKPGGLHVMLMDLKQPIKVGDKLALTLVFEDKASKQRERVEVQAEARQLGAPLPAEHHH